MGSVILPLSSSPGTARDAKTTERQQNRCSYELETYMSITVSPFLQEAGLIVMQLSSASQSASEQAVYDPQYSQIWVLLNSTPRTISFEAPSGQLLDCCQCLQMTHDMSSNTLLCCSGLKSAWQSAKSTTAKCIFINDHVCIAHAHALLFFIVCQTLGQAFGNS